MSPEEISSRRLSCARVPTLPSSSSTTCRLNAAENFLLSAMFRSFLLHRHSNLWRKTVQCQGVSPSRLVIGSEKELADLPVLVWRAAQGKAFQNELAKRTVTARTFKDVPQEIRIVLDKVNELEIVDSLGVAISWR